MAALAPALRRRPMAEPPERDVLKASSCPACRSNRSAQNVSLPDQEAIWLWHGQPRSTFYPCGRSCRSRNSLDDSAGQPLRVLRIDPELWTQALNPPLQAPDQKAQLRHLDLWDNDRYADLLTPEPQGDRSG